jgi:aminopeptidase N
MPTYLLAFVVSDLEYLSFAPNDPTKQRIYANKEFVDEETIASLFYSENFLELLEGYLNSTYSLPKLYSAALPDHGSAMENYVCSFSIKFNS